MQKNKLPIAIIGAGPIGLAAAAHLSLRGEKFIVFEAGDQIADSVRSWEHVPMFSPWKYNVDKAAKKILQKYNWKSPDTNYLPTGKELIEQYLLPLSDSTEIKPYIKLSAKVTHISRMRINKVKNYGRENAPFILHVQYPNRTETIFARAVIDASGTWKNPNPIGSDGLFAPGEKENNNKIFYGIPDVLGKDKNRYINKNIAVVGGGHSAINTILELAELKKEFPKTEITWVLRKANINDAYGGLDKDELPGRGKVGQNVKALVESQTIKVLTPFFVDRISKTNEKLVIQGESPQGTEKIMVDEIVGATGLRPDLEMLREIRISLDSIIESPNKLAGLIDPNVHSCGSVQPHGAVELMHPEKDFYIVGMKSYGRAPTFLLATGHEQIRSVVAALAGDWEAAKKVHLKLPETGVCGVPAAVNPNDLAGNRIDA